ncbi:GNAT family N-acetyltransferase [Segnochrobactrum spirostomi]|uniref:N-acetyltransferase n=1 Tax=Segnochrobactrum spirostomi TaxID=2608987 RepID=A0A6A7Y4D5_9HYPH|nr:N-acetyltransferase [Segnochrobactrum spirostomi]MQT12981.1 N-acetyltransferase [Segnochrobactrum spirostomi]
MITLREEAPTDVGAREALLDRVFGPTRFLKSSERIRAGRLAADGLSLIAEDAATGALVGTVRLWHVSAGGRPALLLGPLAVAPELQGAGLGSVLMRRALNRAAIAGHGAVLLVGDPEYYVRFGFSGEKTEILSMPGPTERRRFLALELQPGALDRAAGRVVPTGRRLDADVETLIPVGPLAAGEGLRAA